MASSDQFCTLCEQNHIARTAEIWCYECQDYLCLDCRRPHSVSRLSKRHTTVSIDEYKKLPSYIRSIKHICEEHDEHFDSFCPTHNITCCRKCILLDHKNCTDISLLEETLQTVNQTTRLSKLDQSVGDVMEYIQKVKSNRTNYKKMILKQEQTVKDDISKVRKRLNNSLDDIERTTLRELSQVVHTEISNNDKSIQTLFGIEKDVTILSRNIQLIKENATNMQVLLGVQEIESSLVSAKRSLETFRKEGKTDSKSITFDGQNVETIIRDMKSFGTLASSKAASSMDIIDSESTQAQIFANTSNTYDSVSLKLNRTIEIPQKTHYNFICGCTFLPDNKVLIGEFNTGRYYDRIILIDEKGTNKKVHFKESRGRSISIFDIEKASKDGNTIAFSTRSSKVFLLNLIDSRLTEIPIDGDTNGLSYHDGTLYCCLVSNGIKGVNIEDDTNNVLDVLSFKCGTYSYIAYHKDYLYYIKTESSIECCDIKGNVVWSFEDIEVLKQPRGIVVDKNGNIFVVGGLSENIVVISTDGKKCREILKKDSGLSNPRAIAYDQEHNRLLICNNQEKAFIYDVVFIN